MCSHMSIKHAVAKTKPMCEIKRQEQHYKTHKNTIAVLIFTLKAAFVIQLKKSKTPPPRHRSSPLASCDRNTLWSIEMSTKDILPATFPSAQVSEVTTTSRKHKRGS